MDRLYTPWRLAYVTRASVETPACIFCAALHRGEKIELRGFGSFRLRRRQPRKGRNPKTGDRVDVPPKKVPYFKPGKELKDLINKSERVGELKDLKIDDRVIEDGLMTDD